jgi:alkanesulfonate monooxygenase SsuD/methylene tetrahydromethanopterin reductase-like flavin-dependent oxidoreductase (luciferase family)
VQKLTREAVTLDHLSGGRLVLGLGLASDNHGELSQYGEETDPKARGQMLDDALERLSAYWGGELQPPPVQKPRIPIWLASRWPSRRPVRRAARWDGLFPIELPGPDELAVLVEEVGEQRGPDAGTFDFVVANPAGTDPAPWEQAGATWCLTDFGRVPSESAVREGIEAGPNG